jgi:hypothetical protein
MYRSKKCKHVNRQTKKEVSMKKFLSLTVLFVMLSASAVFAADYGDILFVVDESGSMNTEHAWIAGMVGSMESGLVAAGVGDVTPNQYGMVTFGSSSVSGGDPVKESVGGGDWGTAAELATTATSLVASGGTEDGYEAIMFALNNYTFRSGAALNIILITDEDRDVTTGDTYASTLAALNQKNALLNVVVNNSFGSDDGAALGRFADSKDLNPLFDKDGNPVPGGTAAIENAIRADGLGGYVLATGATTGSGFGTTATDYVQMALENGGAAWDLNILRAGGNDATSFTAAFVDFKALEVKGQPPVVPDAAIMYLLGTGLFGLGALYRRKTSK